MLRLKIGTSDQAERLIFVYHSVEEPGPMNKAAGPDARNRLSALVANSLDTQARTQDLARQNYQSRTQFHRLFRAVVGETPAAMRRRLLLERAAYQLAHTAISVTEIALDANYNSLEAFTRAFRFAGNDSWHTRRLLEYAGNLTAEQLDRPLPTVVELLPWRESNNTLRQLLETLSSRTKSGPPHWPGLKRI